MKRRKPLLLKLLRTLVDEWGFEEVASTLADMTVYSKDPSAEGAEVPRARPSRKKAKLTATEQIERAIMEGEQKQIMLQLAARYDQKLFLPRLSDVREFLSMMGEKPIGMKDRSEAFRILLRGLLQMPMARVQQLAQTALYSGPSELGPLSDAIAAAGERLPRQRQLGD